MRGSFTHTHTHLTVPRVVVLRKCLKKNANAPNLMIHPPVGEVFFHLKPAETDVFSLVILIVWSILIN